MQEDLLADSSSSPTQGTLVPAELEAQRPAPLAELQETEKQQEAELLRCPSEALPEQQVTQPGYWGEDLCCCCPSHLQSQ